MHHMTKWQRKGNHYQPTLYGLDELLNEMVGPMSDFTPEFLNTPHHRRLEMKVDRDHVTARLAVPGCKPADVNVEVLGDYLTVRAKRSDNVEPGKDKHYIRRERSFESYEETVKLPVKVKGSECKAKCADGVLTITMPREGETKPAAHVVNVQ